ncbi:hypothetical protein SAMN05216227_1004118 [Pseudorhodobacter antarcticus]|jgi:hypothetical protein|uniref:UPF0434 protein SAMN05216227_1004118 n=1 Tax=Pseudorhodobacter antarcticus TaxID=1077947 RepID=A0A1H8C9Z6_9RHOB|nr:hypothetical protein SAMN05216227_1004118 [Pseudorhodobacter antarcticus]
MSDAPTETDPDIGPEIGTQSGPVIDRRMLEALVCPLSHATLSYDAEAQELISRPAKLAFPIRNGIPIMLVSEARAME